MTLDIFDMKNKIVFLAHEKKSRESIVAGCKFVTNLFYYFNISVSIYIINP